MHLKFSLRLFTQTRQEGRGPNVHITSGYILSLLVLLHPHQMSEADLIRTGSEVWNGIVEGQVPLDHGNFSAVIAN